MLVTLFDGHTSSGEDILRGGMVCSYAVWECHWCRARYAAAKGVDGHPIDNPATPWFRVDERDTIVGWFQGWPVHNQPIRPISEFFEDDEPDV
jgi:hypothetical protein